MAADPSDLTTLADVKSYLSIAGTTDDVLLQRMITSASNFIQSWLNRTFKITTYTETFNGNDGYTQAFSNYPCTGVTSLKINNVVIPLITQPFQYGYQFDTKFLYLTGFRFYSNLKMNIQLTYSAGYATVPFEIAQACIEFVSLRYKERTRIGEVSKHMGTETITYSQKDFPESVKTILKNYRKVIPY